MELPIEVQALIAAGIGFLVTEGLKAAGLNVEGLSAKVTALVATCVIGLANLGLSFIPAQYQEAVGYGFGLLVAVLSAFGIHRQVKRFSKR